jgi:hypothetical protein
LLAALARLVLAAVLAALTTLAALAALMLLTRPVLRAMAALTSLPAALLRTLLLLVALRFLLLVRHWDILRLLVWENSPRRQSINAWQELKFLSLATPDTVNEL